MPVIMAVFTSMPKLKFLIRIVMTYNLQQTCVKLKSIGHTTHKITVVPKWVYDGWDTSSHFDGTLSNFSILILNQYFANVTSSDFESFFHF